MRAGEIASKLREALGPKALRIETPTERRVFLTVKEEDLEDAMKAVMGLAREARFSRLPGHLLDLRLDPRAPSWHGEEAKRFLNIYAIIN